MNAANAPARKHGPLSVTIVTGVISPVSGSVSSSSRPQPSSRSASAIAAVTAPIASWAVFVVEAGEARHGLAW